MTLRRTAVVLCVGLILAGSIAPVFAAGGVAAEDREPNDSFSSAVTISEGSFSGEIVDGESDFYKLDANSTDALRAEITSADTLSDIALRIYDSDGQQLVSDGNDFEGVNGIVKLPESGTYYIEVVGQSRDTNSGYTLDVDVITPAENDQFAPNDGFESAAPLEEGFSEARIVGGESDFYRIKANATDALSVDISSADTLDDLQLRLYNSNREQLVADGNDFEGVNFNLKLPENSTYYVEVAGQSQQTTSKYTLNADIITPAENDQFAPNDDFESAAPIPEGVSEARIVGGESDFYRLNATTDDAIQMDITQADALSDVAIRLYDEDRTQLVADGNDFEGIGYTLKAPTTGTYYVEIAGQSQQTTSEYTVATDIITPAENDQFAPNDGFESAAQLREEFTDARIVGGEADYYKLTLNESERLDAELASAASLSDLVIELYGPDQTRLASDGNDFEGLTLTHQADQAGTYYIRVAGQSQQTTSTYRLRSNQTFTGASPVQIEDVTLTPQTVERNTTNEHTLTFSVTNVSADGVNDTVTIAIPEGLTVQESSLTLADQRANEFSVSDATPADGTLTLALNPQPDTGPATRTLDSNATLTVATANASATTTEEITITATDSENGDDTASATLTVQGPGPGDLTGNGEPAQDLDGDGAFEDVNGDGQYTVSDVQALFAVRNEAEGQAGLDFNGDGQVTISDVQALFAEL